MNSRRYLFSSKGDTSCSARLAQPTALAQGQTGRRLRRPRSSRPRPIISSSPSPTGFRRVRRPIVSKGRIEMSVPQNPPDDGAYRRSRSAHKNWTPETVKEHLSWAMRIIAMTPDQERRMLRGASCSLPSPIRTFWEGYGSDAERRRFAAIKPTGQEIADATDAMCWLLEIKDVELRTLVMARASGARWPGLCLRFGFTRRTLTERHKKGLTIIAKALNRRH